MPPPQITIEKLRPINGSGSLRAFCDLRIGESIFRSFRVIQQPGQDAWVSPPSESWTGNDGKKQFTRLIEFPERLQKAVEVAVLAAWTVEPGK
jgi:hypothetical protein